MFNVLNIKGENNMKFFSIIVIACFLGAPIILLANSTSSTNDATNIKYQAYADIDDNIMKSFFPAMDIYLLRFGYANEVLIPKEESNLEVITLTALNATILGRAMEFVDKEPRFFWADDNLKAMNRSYAKLVIMTKELDEYYKSKSYINDNFARHKELHHSIIDTTNLFEHAYARFLADLSFHKEKMKK